MFIYMSMSIYGIYIFWEMQWLQKLQEKPKTKSPTKGRAGKKRTFGG